MSFGALGRVMSLLFGGGNIIKETTEVFRQNAEAAGVRDGRLSEAALAQFAAEFAVPRRGWFDRTMDGVNRLPRPALAMGTLALFVAAMVDPVWFASRMEGIALVPEPLWWLLGAIVSFYFGARHQAKGQDFQRSIAETLALAPAIAARRQASKAQDRAAEENGPDADLPDDARPPSTGIDIASASLPGVDRTVRSTKGPVIAPAGGRIRDPRRNWALDDWKAEHGK